MPDQNYDDVVDFFNFYPSKALSIVGLTLFLVAALSVFGMTIKTRQWFMVVASSVGLMEMGGYAARISMLNKPVFGAFVAMQCLLIIPPSFLALVQYITLGKAVALIRQRFPDRKLLVKPRVVIWVFFAIEIVALACQGAGAGLSVNDDDTPTGNESAGKALLLVGLALLVILIICYGLTAIYINLSPLYGVRQSPNMRKLFPILYACTTLLLIRNIFRLVEFAQGFYGSLATQEKYFYTLDALMILFILIINTVFHFGLYLKAYPLEQSKVSESASAVEMA